MKRKYLILELLMISSISLSYSQKVVSEIQVELTSAQKKHEPSTSVFNQKSGGLTIFFEPVPAPYVKGEKRKYERYEIQLDKDMNLFSGDFRLLDTKSSLKPILFLTDCSFSYYTWVDNAKNSKFNKLMLQLIKFDNDNNITDSKSYELCEESGFCSYKISSYNGKLILLVQYENIMTRDKNNVVQKSHLLMKTIDVSTLEVKNETELNLSGNDELGCEAFLIENDKIYLAATQISQSDSISAKFSVKWFLFSLNMDGSEAKRMEFSIPGNALAIGSVFLKFNDNHLYLIGEYGDLKDMQKSPQPPYGATSSVSIKSTIPYLGIYLKLFNSDLDEKSSATFSYKDDVLPKMKKGNKNFIKKGSNFNFQNFHFLDDGSFFLTAELYYKMYNTVLTTNDYYNVYTNYTAYNFMDGIVFKFNTSAGLEWLVQIDRDNYIREYSGFMKDKKPQESGKLISYLLPNNKLAVLYNTPGRKYSVNRYGLSEIMITPQGVISNPFEFTSELQFELIDGGIIDVGNNEILAVGTNTKSNNLWIKKIYIFE